MMISSLNQLSHIQMAAPVSAPQAAPKASAEQAPVQNQISDTLEQSREQGSQISSRTIMQAFAQTSQTSQSAPAQEAAPVKPQTNEEVCNKIADVCNRIAVSGGSVEERTDSIMEFLAPGVEIAESPDPSWVKATPEQLRMFVSETLEHIDALREIGNLRGMDFSTHDMEDGCGKFNPKVAQFLALPGRNDAVKWGISQHNAAGHHDTWKDPNASKEQLAESASDIINAWRMERPVYNKPSWSWEKINDVIQSQFQDNMITSAQRDALYEAIPFQMDYEDQKEAPVLQKKLVLTR